MVMPLNIQNLVKKYGDLTAVDGLTFDIKPGEIFGLLGPNGAGKTSAISCIVGLEMVTSGKIEVFGKNPSDDLREAKKDIGMVPQEIANHGYFNIEEVLGFFSGYYGYRNHRAKNEEILKKLSLWDKRGTLVKQLSGGMKRRLMIAKALCHEPRLILLDEPTAGVDIQLRTSIWEMIRELKKEGRSVLLTTHYLDEAENLCDRVGVLDHGKFLMIGETSHLIKKLTHREISVHLKNKSIQCNHPALYEQKDGWLSFRIPHSKPVGELLSEVDWSVKDILDISTKEGSLEQAFIRLLREKK